MRIKINSFLLLYFISTFSVFSQFSSDNGDGTFRNPAIWADVPDMSVIRVNKTYYMVSTTMHMSPGIPVMRSIDLVNWEIVSYCYNQLDKGDAYSLKNGKNDYSWGSWASNIRYDPYMKRFFVITASQSTGKSYFFSTDSIEKGQWRCDTIDKCYDPGFLFADRGTYCQKYVFYGQGAHYYREITIDPVTFKPTLSPEKLWKKICNFENPAQGLGAEGAHGVYMGGMYYLFMIQGQGAQRQEIVWRGKEISDTTTWEVRKIFNGNIEATNGGDYLPSTGVAQGGPVDTPEGEHYIMLFQDYGAVGRIPVLIPVICSADGWPIVGNDGTSVDHVLPKLAQGSKPMSLLSSDEFDNGTTRYVFSDKDLNSGITAGISVSELAKIAKGNETDITNVIDKNEFGYNGSNLGLNWQWNHNPNNNLWSLLDRPGYLRLKSGILSPNIRTARNTLTQRTYGPVCSGNVAIELENMKDGDVAGLAAFQNRYGFVGVKMINGKKQIIMQKAMKKDDQQGAVIASVDCTKTQIYLRIDFDFSNTPQIQHTDKANFYYSLDNKSWTKIGDELQMTYDWPDFMGYRFGLFYYSTQNRGGYVDFDYFHVDDKLLY